MSQGRPGSVSAAIWTMTALLVVSGLNAALTAVFKQDLIDAWATDIADTSSVQPPAFAAVSIVMFSVVAMLAFVLLAFFRSGFGWARVTLTVLVLAMAVGSIVIVQTGPPAVFLVLAVISLGLEAAVVVLLWHRDTGAFLASASEASASV